MMICRRKVCVPVFRMIGCVKLDSKRNGLISPRTKNAYKKFIFKRKVKVLEEFVGTYCLILDIGFDLDLMDTFYVPSITRNLVSLFKLDVARYSLKFRNGCFNLYKCTCKINSGTLYDDLYELNLDNLYVETRMTLRHDVGEIMSKL